MQLIQQVVDFGITRVFVAEVRNVGTNHFSNLLELSRLSVELMHNMVHVVVQYISKWGCSTSCHCHFRSGEMEAHKFYQF